MPALVIDDETLCRRTLRHILDGETRTEATILDGLAEALVCQPSLIILDVAFPGDRYAGLRALPKFRTAAPLAKIVVLTGNYSEKVVEWALRDGASICASKDAPADELADLFLEIRSRAPVRSYVCETLQ